MQNYVQIFEVDLFFKRQTNDHCRNNEKIWIHLICDWLVEIFGAILWRCITFYPFVLLFSTKQPFCCEISSAHQSVYTAIILFSRCVTWSIDRSFHCITQVHDVQITLCLVSFVFGFFFYVTSIGLPSPTHPSPPPRPPTPTPFLKYYATDPCLLTDGRCLGYNPQWQRRQYCLWCQCKDRTSCLAALTHRV